MRGVGDALDNSCVLHGEESLRHDDVKKNGEHERCSRHKQSRLLPLQHPAQGASVEFDYPVKHTLRGFVETPPFLLGFVFEQSRAHHRRKCERDQG